MVDRNILADEIVNLLVAGRDTTAGTLTYGIYKLAQHPDIAEKLRAEILDKVGPTRRPTYDDIRDMKCKFAPKYVLLALADTVHRLAGLLKR